MNILITGTSTGFGKLTAISLAARGHRVLATMRDPGGKNAKHADDLKKHDRIEILELDVTSDASVNAAVEKAGPLDVVVNNAGRAVVGLCETITSEQLLDLLNTNVVGMQRVNRAVLPGMRERRSGLLIHVSSTLGRIVMPVVGLYASTKWCVEGLAETYRYDLKPTGVESCIVQPGAYPTELGSGESTGREQQRAAGYGDNAGVLAWFGETMGRMKTSAQAPNPQEVADGIVSLVEMPAGTRPARLVIDASKSPLTPSLNDAHAAAQKQLLTAIGRGGLAD